MGKVQSEASKELNVRIADLARSGLSASKIGVSLGLSTDQVSHRLITMRGAGILPPGRVMQAERRKSVSTVSYFSTAYDVRLGTMYEVAGALDQAELEWLYKITPKGGKVSETIASIVRDTHAEETAR